VLHAQLFFRAATDSCQHPSCVTVYLCHVWNLLRLLCPVRLLDTYSICPGEPLSNWSAEVPPYLIKVRSDHYMRTIFYMIERVDEKRLTPGL
jgi:hypothetical protein